MSATRIGESPRRVGGYERVTGAQRYMADLRLEDMLHVKLVHVDCAHARIRAIDTVQARGIEDVRFVMTADDLPRPVPRFGPSYRDRPVLAVEETKYHGEPVAAVAAETSDAAAAAAAMVRVDYDELPAVVTVAGAIDSQSTLVQDPALRPDDPLGATNVLREWHYGWGNIDDAPVDLTIENHYSFPMVTHFAIEPHVFMAAPEEDGVVIWSAIQHPYLLQRVIATMLDLPVAKVRVIAPDPGGGFGGKGYPKYEPLLALLALRTGRPVRLVLTLEETFQAVRRSSCEVRVRTGFDSGGTIAFQDIESNFLIGAYVDVAARVVGKSSYAACGPYRVPHARIVARALLSHTTPSTAFRGFGTPQHSWAVESQMDEAARRLHVDRLEIRLRNLAERGDDVIPGDTPADGNWAEVLHKAAEAVGWETPPGEGRGRGIAVGMKASATAGASYSIVRLHYDGSVSVVAGTSDMGQGARTVVSQIVSHELGVPLGRIMVVMGDTATVPFDYSTSASRSTVYMGRAVLNACLNIKAQLEDLAVGRFLLSQQEVSVDRDVIRLGNRELNFVEFLEECFGPVRGEVIAVGAYRGEYVPGHPLGGSPSFWEVNCTAAEVEVDRETGETLIRKLVTVGDIGKAINPQHVEMQDEGAAVMGLGHTLMEHLILDESGRIVNLGALDYRIPTMKDFPAETCSMVVENEDGPGPYGAKGTGEGGLLATAPAVASAVSEATGVVIRDLPLTPERIWRAMVERNQ